MNIAIIDDSGEEGNAVLSLVRTQMMKYCIPIRLADYYSSGDSFFRNWSPGRYDIIFLDIFLANEIGIEIAKTIRRIDYRVTLVFCSSSNSFASESYEVSAKYYLVKPVTAEKIDMMIQQLHLLPEEEDSILLPDNTRLLLSTFLYSEYHNHSITIHCTTNGIIKVWSSQKDFYNLLKNFPYFLCINPGTILNMREVVAFSGDDFQMSDGSRLPISRKKKKELTECYNNFLFEELRKGNPSC